MRRIHFFLSNSNKTFETAMIDDNGTSTDSATTRPTADTLNTIRQSAGFVIQPSLVAQRSPNRMSRSTTGPHTVCMQAGPPEESVACIVFFSNRYQPTSLNAYALIPACCDRRLPTLSAMRELLSQEKLRMHITYENCSTVVSTNANGIIMRDNNNIRTTTKPGGHEYYYQIETSKAVAFTSNNTVGRYRRNKNTSLIESPSSSEQFCKLQFDWTSIWLIKRKERNWSLASFSQSTSTDSCSKMSQFELNATHSFL